MVFAPTCADVLVVDTGALLKMTGDSLRHLASEKLVTIPEVLAELRDKQSRDQLTSGWLGTLLISGTEGESLQVRSPSPASVKAVSDFARLTGDYASLSVPDLRVLALTYEMQTEICGTKGLRREPLQVVTQIGKQKPDVPRRKPSIVNDIAENLQEKLVINNEPSRIDKKDDDEEDGWITPTNIARRKAVDMQGKPQNISNSAVANENVKVACITTDFAMQNVILQMGLNLISVEGIRVRSIKNWVLRCHACFSVSRQMDRKFCDKCGGPTLIRTSVAVDPESGEMRLFLKRNFQYNNRGTKYTIPKPKTGRQENLIFREDQKEYVRAMQRDKYSKEKSAKKEEDVADDMYQMLFSGTGKLSSKLSKQFQPAATVRIGYGRKNPNEVRKTK